MTEHGLRKKKNIQKKNCHANDHTPKTEKK